MSCDESIKDHSRIRCSDKSIYHFSFSYTSSCRQWMALNALQNLLDFIYDILESYFTTHPDYSSSFLESDTIAYKFYSSFQPANPMAEVYIACRSSGKPV